MIKISDKIFLKKIESTDCETLFLLMQQIYPPAYSHFWTDLGAWYINSQYSKENVLKELDNENAGYYFVIYKDEIIGNFRFIWNEKRIDVSEEKQLKLHRLYLHEKIQGKGIGKTLLNWLTEEAIAKNYKIIWLDAMNKQSQAFEFYKKLGFNYYSHTYLPFELMYKEYRKMSQLFKKIG